MNAIKKYFHVDELPELIEKYGIPKTIELCTSWTDRKEICTELVNKIGKSLIKLIRRVLN